MPDLALPVIVVGDQPRAARPLVRYPTPLLAGIVDLQEGKPTASRASIVYKFGHDHARTTLVSCG